MRNEERNQSKKRRRGEVADRRESVGFNNMVAVSGSRNSLLLEREERRRLREERHRQREERRRLRKEQKWRREYSITITTFFFFLQRYTVFWNIPSHLCFLSFQSSIVLWLQVIKFMRTEGKLQRGVDGRINRYAEWPERAGCSKGEGKRKSGDGRRDGNARGKRNQSLGKGVLHLVINIFRSL